MTDVKVQMQWVTQAQFAGYYAALAQGYYEDLGLNVELLEGSVDIVPEEDQQQLVVLLLVFFPIFINTTRGLTDIDPDQIDLMRSYGASRWQIAKEVRIPNAMPFFFTALKIAVALAVIAAIVSEYFGGRQDALGPLIVQNAGLMSVRPRVVLLLSGRLPFCSSHAAGGRHMPLQDSGCGPNCALHG